MLSQMGVAMTKLFYQELGVDTGAIQSHYIWMTGLNMLLITLDVYKRQHKAFSKKNLAARAET